MDELNARILAKDVMKKNLLILDSAKIERNFIIVDSKSDLSDTMSLMKEKNAEIVLVKKNKVLVGIITKKEIDYIEPLLFN
jgi:predicted transcriptional regulator